MRLLLTLWCNYYCFVLNLELLEKAKRKAEKEAKRAEQKKLKKSGGNDEISPAWAEYMKEVEAYKGQSCKESGGTPLVK
eukprot:m.69193 g.69193  ORF g.69193 m.69193 type:complete len:79 (-) comp12031_c0_seq2:183-419(-)